FAVGAEGERPVNHADPVVRLGIFWLQLNVLLVVGLRFFETPRIIRSASHLEQDGADPVNGIEVVRIGVENVFEFRDGLLADVAILLRRSAGDVLAGVSSGEIEASVEQRRIEILGLLEILDGGIVLAVLEGLYTLVKQVTRLQFVAAGKAGYHKQQRQKRR